MQIGRILALVVGWILALIAIAWSAAALWIDGPAARWLAGLLAVAFLLAALTALIAVRPPGRAAVVVAALIGVVVVWWNTIPARNDRDWLPDVAQLSTATIDGDRLTIRNVRNFDYRTETDFTERWETRTYDLSQLRGGDMFFSFWGPTLIAHTIASWDFGDGQHLAISIETRKERGESYSALRGFFRQYELYYVVADERDVIGVRTNHRGERVFLYRIRLSAERSRPILLDYLAEVNRLAAQPRWYNALTQNCTTTIRDHARHVGSVQPWSWQILANGYLDQLWYERGVLDQSLPFAELKTRSDITERARAAGNDPAFSVRIREGLPGAAGPPLGPHPLPRS
jgi:Domain of unknown function (DUF4105)